MFSLVFWKIGDNKISFGDFLISTIDPPDLNVESQPPIKTTPTRTPVLPIQPLKTPIPQYVEASLNRNSGLGKKIISLKSFKDKGQLGTFTQK